MMTNFAFFFLSVLLVFSAGTMSFQGYSVYRIKNYTKEQLRVLRNDPLLDFWSINDVMVSPNYKDSFLAKLNQQQIAWEILIPDLQIIVDTERRQQLEAPSSPPGRAISFAKYHRYDEIKAYLAQLAAQYPKVATVASIGKSSEGRDIPILKISSGGKGNRSVILIDAGIHAREWIAPAMALYIIQELVENSTNADLISSVDWHIIPLLNPDGYEYTHTNIRFWRKTRSATQSCPGTKGDKNGVDANRNFDFHWMEVGASSNPCSQTFAGHSAFSEPETVALRNYVKTTRNIEMYLTFHSYGNLILYPWGYTKDLPPDWKILDDLAKKADEAQRLVGGKPYKIGSPARILYPAAGGSDDWVKGVGGVNFSYAIELPGGSRNSFDMPTSEIAATTRTFWPAVRVFGEYVSNN